MKKFLRSDRSLEETPSAACDPSCHRHGLGGGLPSLRALAAALASFSSALALLAGALARAFWSTCSRKSPTSVALNDMPSCTTPR